MHAQTMLQVVANILAIPIKRLDLTGSQAYRNGYDLDMDHGHDVDIMVNDVDRDLDGTLLALQARYPHLDLTWVNNAGYDHEGYDRGLPYMGVCGFQVNLIDLDPDAFHAWQYATTAVKAEWYGVIETWRKEARVAFFKAARDSYAAGLVAGRQGR